MRTIVQLSDLHFGRVDAALLDPLQKLVTSMQPDVLVVSGDLTQRARKDEFIAARHYLDRLPNPKIVVPGNHDIPLYNVFSRFLTPLVKYRRYIESNLQPVFIDTEIAVLGINTARSMTFKDGRISPEQIAGARQTLGSIGKEVVKVIVTHHPFDLPDQYDEDDLVGRAPLAMSMFAECGADLLLAGHMHTSHAGQSATRYRIGDYSAVVCQAGTATSTRGRGEMNSFNHIRVGESRIIVEQFSWSPQHGRFEPSASDTFDRSNDRWCRTQ